MTKTTIDKVNISADEESEGTDVSVQTEWQPIETAPKDGKFLAGRFVKKCRQGRNGRMRVDTHKLMNFNHQYWPATHWMPLPTEPTP